MSTQTPNLHLVKPDYVDTADVGVINSNMDLIDSAYGRILSSVYPVGSIYMSVAATSPATLFGGTWEQLKDRFLIGAGGSYSAGATGGATAHTLTVAEMPSHNHSFTGSAVTSGGISANHAHTGTSGNPSANHTHSGPNHSHGFTRNSNNKNGIYSGNNEHVGFWTSDAGSGSKWPVLSFDSSGSGRVRDLLVVGPTDNAGTGATGTVSAYHTHTTTTGNQSAGHTHSVTASGTIGNKGSGSAFSIMNPYLAVYMWKRTA